MAAARWGIIAGVLLGVHRLAGGGHPRGRPGADWPRAGPIQLRWAAWLAELARHRARRPAGRRHRPAASALRLTGNTTRCRSPARRAMRATSADPASCCWSLVLPFAFGQNFAQVIVLVAIYILMGLGLNITLGLAGLLDLGFVAFFAVGAYTVGLLTSTSPFGIADWSFWVAVPFAVGVAFLFGAFLGLPILGIRGDYLAIATLGFGEIIRILSVSDLLRPCLGGPQGITNVPKPIDGAAGRSALGPEPDLLHRSDLRGASSPSSRSGCAIRASAARGSRSARTRTWPRRSASTSIQTKLLAYALGAAFAGLGGAVFAALVGAIFPTSINLLVSINVAALIIVGGMGSIPGVVVGAIVLIGLPELFREFPEYRYLFYGAALMVLMRFRPEGLLPSRSVQARAARRGERRAAGAPRWVVGRPARGGARGEIAPTRRTANRRHVTSEIPIRSARWRCSRPAAQRSGSADWSPSTRSTSPWSRARSSASSGPTARARRRSSTASPASTGSTTGTITFDGQPIHGLPPDKIAHLGHQPDLPEHPAVRQHDGHGERARRTQHSPHARELDRGRAAHAWHASARSARPTTRRADCCATSASRARATSRPASSPTAISVGSRWPAHWPTSRACCCSTSRPPA